MFFIGFHLDERFRGDIGEKLKSHIKRHLVKTNFANVFDGRWSRIFNLKKHLFARWIYLNGRRLLMRDLLYVVEERRIFERVSKYVAENAPNPSRNPALPS